MEHQQFPGLNSRRVLGWTCWHVTLPNLKCYFDSEWEMATHGNTCIGETGGRHREEPPIPREWLGTWCFSRTGSTIKAGLKSDKEGPSSRLLSELFAQMSCTPNGVNRLRFQYFLIFGILSISILNHIIVTITDLNQSLESSQFKSIPATTVLFNTLILKTYNIGLEIWFIVFSCCF